MFCQNCGAQNPDNVLYCSKCGKKLSTANIGGEKPDSSYWKESYNYASFSVSKRVNATLGIMILVLGIVAIVLSFIPFGVIISSVLVLVNAVLLVILMFQWAEVINQNSENSSKLLTDLSSKGILDSAEFNSMISTLRTVKIDLTMYWLYIGFYVLSSFLNWIWLWSGGFIFSFLSFIFMMIFLQNTFSSEQKLQQTKNRFYSFRMGSSARQLNQIKQRNVFLLILFTIITLGIYWWYILINHSQEINDFLDADEFNLKNLR